MNERLDREMKRVYALSKEELDRETDSSEWDSHISLVSKLLKRYLDKYHSDMRWMIKYYVTNPDNWPIRSFQNEKYSYLNYQFSNENYVIYGSTMHEFFYDKFAAYEYHEFCFREIKADIETIFNIRGYEYTY